jgi:enamine deaminase RidA (YjgF/YER057c/UK114 family)
MPHFAGDGPVCPNRARRELHSNPAFVIGPAARTLYVGGQLGTNSTENLLDGIEAQTTQAMRNVLTVLAAAVPVPSMSSDSISTSFMTSTHRWDMRRRDQCGVITARPSRSFPPQDTLAQARSWRSTQ